MIYLRFYGENMVNLITKMVNMDIVRRKCGEFYYLWRFNGKISMGLSPEISISILQ